MSTPKTAPTPARVRLFRYEQEALMNATPARPPYFTPSEPMPEMPTTVQGCFEFLRKHRHLSRRRDLVPAWRELIIRVIKLGHTLQQTPAAPNIDAQAEGRVHAEILGTAEADRRAETEALQAALATDWQDEPIAPMMHEINPVLVTFLSTPEGLEAARALRSALASYEIRRNELYALISPASRAEERKLALNSRPTPEQSAKIAGEVTLEATSIFGQLSANANGELGQLWQDTVPPLEIALLERCIEFVTNGREAAQAAEENFFASAGVPRESTGVSRMFDGVLDHLKNHLDVIRNGCKIAVPVINAPTARSGHSSILQTVFGCPLLTGV